MFKKETEYALRGLVYIQLQNLKKLRPGIAEIAQEIDAPQSYIAKILNRLVNQGFLKSVKGKGGGFFLESGNAEIPLKDVVTAIEGTCLLTGCGFGLKNCSSKNPCPLHHKFSPIREALNKLVTEETIHSLAKKISKTKKNPLLLSRS